MPIYEFNCLDCRECFELLLVGSDTDGFEMKCPECGSKEIERIISATSYCMKGAGQTVAQPRAESRQCAGGTCTTYDIPGPSR